MTAETIYAALGLTAAQGQMPLNQLNRATVYDVANRYLAEQAREIAAASAIFVDMTTTASAERFKLVGGGTMQRSGGGARAASSRAVGYWDVGYPLEKYTEALANTPEAAALLTVQEFALQIDNIAQKNVNTRRDAMLYRLFNSASYSYTDQFLEDAPTVTVKPLANDDSDTYPPLLGSSTSSTHNHYVTSGYASASISDSNNPLITLRDHLTEHFGLSTGYDNIMVFANKQEVNELEDLADYRPVEDINIRSGDDTDVPVSLPQNTPGAVRGRSNGVWVVEWNWIPAGYLFAFDPMQPKPLKERYFVGAPQGLHLFYRDAMAPYTEAQYQDYFGYGVSNRLNGVAMELTADASYDDPAAYA